MQTWGDLDEDQLVGLLERKELVNSSSPAGMIFQALTAEPKTQPPP
jgi:hypothetical protein